MNADTTGKQITFGTGAMQLQSSLDPMAYYSPAWSR